MDYPIQSLKVTQGNRETVLGIWEKLIEVVPQDDESPIDQGVFFFFLFFLVFLK
jgi:hypothetical protein